MDSDAVDSVRVSREGRDCHVLHLHLGTSLSLSLSLCLPRAAVFFRAFAYLPDAGQTHRRRMEAWWYTSEAGG